MSVNIFDYINESTPEAKAWKEQRKAAQEPSEVKKEVVDDQDETNNSDETNHPNETNNSDESEDLDNSDYNEDIKSDEPETEGTRVPVKSLPYVKEKSGPSLGGDESKDEVKRVDLSSKARENRQAIEAMGLQDQWTLTLNPDDMKQVKIPTGVIEHIKAEIKSSGYPDDVGNQAALISYLGAATGYTFAPPNNKPIKAGDESESAYKKRLGEYNSLRSRSQNMSTEYNEISHMISTSTPLQRSLGYLTDIIEDIQKRITKLEDDVKENAEVSDILERLTTLVAIERFGAFDDLGRLNWKELPVGSDKVDITMNSNRAKMEKMKLMKARRQGRPRRQ